jgi:hypothetical protein
MNRRPGPSLADRLVKNRMGLKDVLALADDRSAKLNDLEITYVSIEAIREYRL